MSELGQPCEIAQGFVYLLSNPAFPGIYKIGHTTRNPYERILELSESTGVPLRYELAAALFVRNAAALEKHLHIEFSCRRVSPNREFFKFDHVSQAVAEFHKVVFEHPDDPIDPLGLRQDQAEELYWYNFMLYENRRIYNAKNAAVAQIAAAETLVASANAEAARQIEDLRKKLENARARSDRLKECLYHIRKYCLENTDGSVVHILNCIKKVLV